MSESSIYRENGDRLLELALRTENVIDRGRLIGLAAQWHMKAADLERGTLPGLDDLELDLDLGPMAPLREAPDEPESEPEAG